MFSVAACFAFAEHVYKGEKRYAFATLLNMEYLPYLGMIFSIDEG
jgi:hypothetical protein